MSLTCVLDLSVNISILAVSCNAFAVLFNSRAPVCAFVLIPERLIAIDFQFCYRGAFYLLIVCQFTHPLLMISHKSSIYFHSRLTLELIVATSISDYSYIYNRGGSSWGGYC